MSRVGASLLGQVGLGDLVATDVDGYVATAARLAGDRERLRDAAYRPARADAPVAAARRRRRHRRDRGRLPRHVAAVGGFAHDVAAMKIRAAVLEPPPNEPFRVEELDLDDPRRGEVLVRSRGRRRVSQRLAPRHRRDEAPDAASSPATKAPASSKRSAPGVDDVAVGDHVVLNWAPSCGHCFYCLRGRPNLCETYTAPIWAGTMLDGTTRLQPDSGEAGLQLLRPRRVRDAHGRAARRAASSSARTCRSTSPRWSAAPSRPASARRCSPPACGRARASSSSAAAASGLNIIQGARLCGAAPIIAVDTHVAEDLGRQSTLARKASSWPATTSIAIAKHHTHGRGADHVFEAVGIPAVQESALDCVRPGGTLTLAGLRRWARATNFPSAVHHAAGEDDQGQLLRHRQRAARFPACCSTCTVRSKLNLDDLITRRYPLEQINEAYRGHGHAASSRGA